MCRFESGLGHKGADRFCRPLLCCHIHRTAAALILAAASGFKSANFEANSHENQQNGVKITVFVAKKLMNGSAFGIFVRRRSAPHSPSRCAPLAGPFRYQPRMASSS